MFVTERNLLITLKFFSIGCYFSFLIIISAVMAKSVPFSNFIYAIPPRIFSPSIAFRRRIFGTLTIVTTAGEKSDRKIKEIAFSSACNANLLKNTYSLYHRLLLTVTNKFKKLVCF